jgi:light-regulated signal transduction histidine kinase (bacteriophytochrome)/CheY-like chemotaxis protein
MEFDRAMAGKCAATDLTNCDREPIHLLGAVQSFGLLIAASNKSGIVTRVSSSVREWLKCEPEEAIGRPITELFTDEAMHKIRGQLHAASLGDTVARLFDIEVTSDGLRCDVAAHIVDDTIVIECEPSLAESDDNTGLMVRGMIARLQQTKGLPTFYRVAAREMRAMTGFDRVMVYRFDEDGAGEVIAETASNGLESYLGLRYPASDVPRQARLLYERNWLRLIADVNAPPSPIEPALDDAGRPLDLSRSVLRSVSPMHVEYLCNMGVSASMSVSILRDGKLWGLFACHHYSPRRVSFARRTAAELFGQMFSFLMENRERESESAYELRAQKLHQQLVTVMAGEATSFESIVTHLEDIADLLTCDGIGVWINNRATLKGLTPTKAEFATLVDHLHAKQISEIHARHEIGAELPQARAFAERAAGMLVVPLSRPARDYLVFFRKEMARSVHWAGDPSKPVTADPLGDRPKPRKSFELWKETVHGQSATWRPVECRIAEGLRVSLLEVILRLSDITEEERRRSLQRQELLIDELNHRVRNILSLIRGVITQSKDPTNSVDNFTKIVGGRIQALARAHDQITADKWGPASFGSMVQAEAGAYLIGGSDRVVLSGTEILLEPQAFTTVALVIHEMITNSVKYGALSDSRGQVRIETAIDAVGRLVIAWSEHGGPPVKPPTHRGFGSTVIERSIQHDLRGSVSLDFALSGLRARFTIPAAQFSLSQGGRVEAAPAAVKPDADPGLMPKDVLLVEDSMIIALDAEDMLRQLGIEGVRVASGVRDSLRLIEERQPDFALLDVNLGTETGFGIAERLMHMGVPFAFATGYGDQLAFPDAFAAIPKLRKPYTSDILKKLLLTQVPRGT